MVSVVLIGWVLGTLGGAVSLEIGDEQYFTMPRLYHLDDYEQCLASRGNVYCVGTFDLLPHTNHRLYDYIQEFSSNTVHHFNHSHIHRGLCLQTACAHIKASSSRVRFDACVNNLTQAQYGLQTNMTQHYCRTKDASRPLDGVDIGFLYVVGFIVVMNVIGTVHDLIRDTDGKPNPLLAAWSFSSNWNRLTADYSDGDPRLCALRPTHGMKALTLILIMMAHSVFAHHMTYLFNPQFLEEKSYEFMPVLFQNGSNIVHSFILISNFLLAYNMLIYNDSSKTGVSLKLLPKYVLHRLIRIAPLNMFIIGLATTWWSRAGDAPLEQTLLEAESASCRRKWWTQALFINNFVQTDDMCLIHTWYLAVDTQLYMVTVVLSLVLVKYPRTAVKLLAAMIVAAVAMNFSVAYYWNLKPMVVLTNPEYLKTQFAGVTSFNWLYSAPWDGLPAALIGVLVAFIHYLQQAEGYQPGQNLFIKILYRLSIPVALAWIFGGHWMRDVTDQFWLSVYAAVDRPVFVTAIAFAMYGFFNKIDSLCWKLLSWRGWEILSRMSLSVYLVHWLLSLTLLATSPHISSASVFDIGQHWLATIFLSYCSALPLHLFVELPAMKFLQSLI